MQPIEELERTVAREVEGASSTGQLRELEIKYLGKNGLVSGLLRQLFPAPHLEA